MVDVDLDRPRKLHYDLAAMRDLEIALGGRPLGSILGDLQSLGINVLVLATYHGLKHEDKALNPKLVERILGGMLREERSLAPLYEALPKAFEATGMFRVESEGKEQAPALT